MALTLRRVHDSAVLIKRLASHSDAATLERDYQQYFAAIALVACYVTAARVLQRRYGMDHDAPQMPFRQM